MRCKYREVRTECGDFLDVDIFPVMTSGKPSKKRGKKYKPTSETMKRYNQRKRETRLERLILTNFGDNGVFFNPSWSDSYLPSSEEDAKRFVNNFFRRLKTFRKRNGLPDLKYIYKLERGKRSGRLHAHMILNCSDMPLGKLDEIWGKGYCFSSKVCCDDEGCKGLSDYFCKEKKPEPKEDDDLGQDISYAWISSRNLDKPKERKRDGRIPKRQAVELCNLGEDAKREYEKLYPGYDFAKARCLYNEVNGGWYIQARMRKRPERKRGRQCQTKI